MLKKTLSWVMVGMLFLSLVFNENLVTKKIDAAEIKNEYVVYDGNKVIGVKKMSVNETRELQNNFWVEENQKMHACEQEYWDVEKVNSKWSRAITNIKEQVDRKENLANSRVKIGIIDSGIDYNENINVVKRVNLIDDCNGNILVDDNTGHGTAIASILSLKKNVESEIQGVNPNLDIYSYKVLDNKNETTLDVVVETIDEAVIDKINILCMSFGMPDNSEILHNAIKKAYDNGIIIIAAAGNESNGEEALYPARYEEVISVGSINAKGEKSEFSNDIDVDIYAPGEMVKCIGDFGAETIANGTSISVPFVAGVVSILFEKDKTLNANSIKRILVKIANVINDDTPILDCRYALDNIKNFKEDNVNKNINKEELRVDDKTMTLKGKWSRNDHAALIKTNLKDMYGNSYTSKQLKLLKAGIRMPDKFWSGASHRMWHAIANSEEDTNYIAGAYYVSKVIKGL